MTKTASFLAATLVGATLLVPAADAFAGHRDWNEEHREWHQDNEWRHHRPRHHHHHHYQRPYVVYEQSYYVPAPPPPPVVYRPSYYSPAYYSDPAVTIGVSIPPLVIPLR